MDMIAEIILIPVYTTLFVELDKLFPSLQKVAVKFDYSFEVLSVDFTTLDLESTNVPSCMEATSCGTFFSGLNMMM